MANKYIYPIPYTDNPNLYNMHVIINNILIPEYIYEKLKSRYTGPENNLNQYLWIIIYRYQLLGSNNNQLGVLPNILNKMKSY